MFIRSFPLGPQKTNCYVLCQGDLALLVDPGAKPGPALGMIRRRELTLTHILLTHLHWDHVHGVAQAARETGAEILAGAQDAFLTREDVGRGTGEYLVEPFDFTPLEPGMITLLNQPCMVLHTPGHSPGSHSFFFPAADAVFVGDLLFRRALGRTVFPGSDEQALFRSVREKIFNLPDEVEIYPGHGPATTVGEEKQANPFLGKGL